MRTIHKYQIPSTGPIWVKMPSDAKVIDFGAQGRDWFIWAIVETDNPMVNREFHICGTGHELPNGYGRQTYIKTAHIGAYVWHLFGVTDGHS